MRTILRILIILLFTGSISLRGQVACGYGFSYTSNVAYTPIPNGSPTLILASGASTPNDATLTSPTDEDIFPEQPIGFSFQFNGSSYTHCGVATNGWIWFGNISPVKAAGMVVPFTNVLASETEIQGIVSALNADLEGRWTAGLASIRTRTSGTSPNRTFTIEWTNFKALDDAEGTGYCGENRNRFDFQIILEESSNSISFAYNTAPYCWQGYNQLFQVGLRGANRSDVHTRSIPAGNESWAQSSLGLSNATAVIRSSSPVTIPAQNARFTFAPAAPQSLTWIGNTTNWNEPQNWNPSTVPNRCNDVIIPGGLSHYPELDGALAANCANLRVDEGAAISFKETYTSFLSCFGSLMNNGVIINNTNSYLTLSGGEGMYIGGTGHFLGTDLFISANSDYSMQSDLVVRNLSINEGSALRMNDKVLDVFSIQQQGIIDQGTGVLVIEGDAASVLLTDSTFEENNGTTFFGNGEVWANQVDQIVPSIHYNHLWVKTKKDHSVQLGTNSDFSCKNLLFYNPGEPGGQARTQQNITVYGDFRLGIDSMPGTELILNHTINRVSGNGSFAMGTQDELNISHSSSNQQAVLSGFSNPFFQGSVSYSSDNQQALVKGTYNNLNINGSGQRFIHGQVNLKGILRLTNGTLSTNDSLTLKSDSSHTALISGAGSGQIQGQVAAERYVSGTGAQEVFLSSAFTAITLDDFKNGIPVPGPEGISWENMSSPAMWDYASGSEGNGWEERSSNSILQKMTGYRLLQTGGSTLLAKGLVNSGNQKIALSYNANAGASTGFNLVGNPYPSPINWNLVASNLPSSISKSIYTTGKTDRFKGQYGTWLSFGNNEGLGVNGASAYVGMQEGFFVRAFAADTLRLNNTHRPEVTDIRAVTVPSSISFIRLSLVKEGKADETLIYYSSQANSNTAIDGKDAQKMTPAAAVSYWYSVKDSVQLAIQGRHTTEHADSIPLNIVVAQAGMHQIRLSDVIHFPMTAMVFLEDRQTNTFQNLRQQPEYSVNLPAGTINGRFFIHYRPGVQVSAIKEGCAGGDGQISLNNPTATAWDAEVFNSNDSLIASHTALTGIWEINQLKADEYRVHFTLNGQNLSTDEWITVAAGSAVNASFQASATEVKMEEEEVVFTNTTAGAQSIFWNFGDGTMLSGDGDVAHTFESAGTYQVVLTVGKDECFDTAVASIYVITITGIEEAGISEKTGFTIYPNPATTVAWLKPDVKETIKDVAMALVDASGRIVLQKNYPTIQPGQLIELPVSQLAKGNYQVVLNGAGFRAANNLVVGGR